MNDQTTDRDHSRSEIRQVAKRLMQIGWLVALLTTLIAVYETGGKDITPMVLVAFVAYTAAICLSVLYVLIAVVVAYFRNQRPPYFAISMFIATATIVGLLIALSNLSHWADGS